MDTGRIAFCSYSFANLLMQDPAFIKYSDKSQEMVIKGILGEVDGTKIVKVPASRLPLGTSFLIVHQMATVAPFTLKEFKTHQDPPGISGWLVEGREIFDAFVLDGKKDCLYIGLCEGTLIDTKATVDTDSKLKIGMGSYVGQLKIKAGTTLPTYGDADTGYTNVAVGDTISADSIIALVVGGKIIGASLIDIA